MTIKAITGMKDNLSPDIALWQAVEKTAREHFSKYFYEEIRTPLLEETSLFERGIGTETGVVKKEMYTFDDKGGDSVTLRPEGTASVVRAYIEHNIQRADPVTKFYYIGPMFRYERPQKGRLRQFHQIGVELFGATEPAADAEVIGMLDLFFQKVGVKNYELQINSLGCTECRVPFQKKLTDHLKSLAGELCADCQERITKNPMRVFDCKVEKCKEKLKAAPVLLDALCVPCKTHFDAVKSGLDAAQTKYIVNPRIARGLDYYQRTAFEFLSNDLGSQNAFAGGGRYDGLVKELGGPDVPAVGFALGMERLILLLGDKKPEVGGKKTYIVFMGSGTESPARKLAGELRAKGMTVEIDYAEKSMKAQLRRAGKYNFDYVIILGESELAKGVAQLKDYKTGEQKEVVFSSIASLF
ncbi:histidine--tRNA ligase [bacterium]|nr:histidine--tRNA ligase [bacterium]